MSGKLQFGIAVLILSSYSLSWAQSGSRGALGSHRIHQQRLAQQQQQQLQWQAEQQRRQRLQAALERQRAAEAASRADEARQKAGVAVVELFTSQGCSSCPSADEALMQVVKVASQRDVRVYALSFHVDYWNRLGWDDPYSQADFTTRQATYAARGSGNQVYTPQMIVNGTDGFVGSDRDQIHRSITSALRTRPQTKIDINVNSGDTPGDLNVEYQLSGQVEDKALNVAVVQTPRSTNVVSGENAGRQLSHVNVVRAFKVVVPETANGVVSIKLLEDFDNSIDYDVIVYAQDKKTYAISGANAITMVGAKLARLQSQKAKGVQSAS